MDTKVDTLKNTIDYARKLIAEGELVAFPTETVYGLGADATNVEAVRKIFLAKGRPQDNPLIVHLSRVEDVVKVAKDIPASFYMIASKFMPGPITTILKKGDNIPYEVTAGRDTVGIRIPSNAIAREFISKCGKPIAAPSANASKHISPTLAEHVYEDMRGKIPLIIDGGASEVGIESTIIDLTSDIPTILRPGRITKQMLSEVLGEVDSFKGKIVASAPAPGMKYKHYAPKVPATLVSNIDEAISAYDNFCGNGVIIAPESCKLADRNFISLGEKGEDFARNIYNALHIAEQNYDAIWIVSLDGDEVAQSVMNRVTKATNKTDI